VAELEQVKESLEEDLENMETGNKGICPRVKCSKVRATLSKIKLEQSKTKQELRSAKKALTVCKHSTQVDDDLREKLNASKVALRGMKAALNDAETNDTETHCVCGAHMNFGIHRRVYPMTLDGLACMTPEAVAKRVQNDDLRRCRDEGFTTKDLAVESGLQGTFDIRRAVYIEPELRGLFAPEGHEGEPRSKTLMGPGKYGYMWETKLGVLHEDGPTTQMFITNNALADSGLLFHHTGPNTGKRIVPSAELAKSDMNLFDRLLDIATNGARVFRTTGSGFCTIPLAVNNVPHDCERKGGPPSAPHGGVTAVLDVSEALSHTARVIKAAVWDNVRVRGGPEAGRIGKVTEFLPGESGDGSDDIYVVESLTPGKLDARLLGVPTLGWEALRWPTEYLGVKAEDKVWQKLNERPEYDYPKLARRAVRLALNATEFERYPDFLTADDVVKLVIMPRCATSDGIGRSYCDVLGLGDDDSLVSPSDRKSVV
jgi:hypothetical protein